MFRRPVLWSNSFLYLKLWLHIYDFVLLFLDMSAAETKCVRIFKCQCSFNYPIAYWFYPNQFFSLALHLLTDKPVCAKRTPPIGNMEMVNRLRKTPQIISLWQCVVMGEMSRGEITYVWDRRVAGSDPDSHVSASFWENGFFFVSDPHNFGKQEQNEAKHFRALKPKKYKNCASFC